MKMKQVFLPGMLAVTLALLFVAPSCKKDEDSNGISHDCPLTFIDARDGQEYKAVLIGRQCWMAENLNFGEMIQGNIDQSNNGIYEKYCHDNDEDNCDIYGGLYQWDELMQYSSGEKNGGLCPEGWHISSDEEWLILEGTVDSQFLVGDPEWEKSNGVRGYDAGKNLKVDYDWKNNNTGLDKYGFSALPSGLYSNYIEDFSNLKYESWWWTPVETSNDDVGIHGFYSDSDKSIRYVYLKYKSSSFGYSVRCLKN